MKNKNKQAFSLVILILVMLSTTLFSCKKNNSDYYNYENSLKQFDGNALEYLQSQKGIYDSLLLVLNRLPDLQDSLRNEKVTLFAVTNKSFQISVENLNAVRRKLNKAPLYLADMNIKELDTMTSKYIIRGEMVTADFQRFVDGLIVKSINHNYNMHLKYDKADASGFIGGGPGTIIFTDPKNSIFVRYWQSTPTNSVNIRTKNAIINVLSPGHDFGFGDFVTRINN
ncbi:hypothetical protein [Pedobacter foliorum]|uniref:hypothetical protein n=1 Tax=Pedobacter foliorum TaxID=2739058 RepID=UPI0015677E0C|nr:hypothetical protein [Pedobacter foliorum]NRF39019.1 hypothetical protein [Pedobacter foliorum]